VCGEPPESRVEPPEVFVGRPSLRGRAAVPARRAAVPRLGEPPSIPSASRSEAKAAPRVRRDSPPVPCASLGVPREALALRCASRRPPSSVARRPGGSPRARSAARDPSRDAAFTSDYLTMDETIPPQSPSPSTREEDSKGVDRPRHEPAAREVNASVVGQWDSATGRDATHARSANTSSCKVALPAQLPCYPRRESTIAGLVDPPTTTSSSMAPTTSTRRARSCEASPRTKIAFSIRWKRISRRWESRSRTWETSPRFWEARTTFGASVESISRFPPEDVRRRSRSRHAGSAVASERYGRVR
jgi:hypothetical protein